MSDAIVRMPVRSAVRNRIIERVVKGTLPSGSAINLASLAAELAVSATPLREALIELERDGFIESSQGRGFFVRPFSAAEIQDLYPLIAELEAFGLRLAPVEAARLRRLESINAELRETADPAKALKLDTLWHAALLAGCLNETLLDLIRGLKQRAQRYEYTFLKESGHRVSTQHHSGIVRALRKGEMDMAAELLKENWNIGPRFLLPWLESRAKPMPGASAAGGR